MVQGRWREEGGSEAAVRAQHTSCSRRRQPVWCHLPPAACLLTLHGTARLSKCQRLTSASTWLPSLPASEPLPSCKTGVAAQREQHTPRHRSRAAFKTPVSATHTAGTGCVCG